jgi:hypothetical protein
MANLADKSPIAPGDAYEGWIFISIQELPLLGGPTTHTLIFRRADDPDDLIWITNGQAAASVQFCLRNGKIDVCPPEFVPFAIENLGTPRCHPSFLVPSCCKPVTVMINAGSG